MPIRKVQLPLRTRRGGRDAGILLPFPVTASLKVAQLSPGLRFAGVDAFLLKRWPDMKMHAPNVVAGTLCEIRALVEQVNGGGVEAATIDRALVVVTRFGTRPLDDVTRVSLWQTFGVPIFELYLGLDLGLLAAECEAHEGWHLAKGVGSTMLDSGELMLDGAGNFGLRTGLRASVTRDACACGRSGPRVLDVEQYRLESRALAAFA